MNTVTAMTKDTGSSNWSGSERRRSARRSSRGVAICRTGKLGMGPQYDGKIVDISQTGAQLALPKELKIGESVEIEFSELACRKGTVVAATVVRAIADAANRRWLIGVHFDKLLPFEPFSKLIRS